jgi:predicted SnoaL-like aldol condensation-catalyzing enzyme
MLLATAGTQWWLDRGPRRNAEVCETIKPGVTVDTLVTLLKGADYQRNGTAYWVSFDTPRVASGPIEARYDSISKRVLELNCGDENGSLWKVDP